MLAEMAKWAADKVPILLSSGLAMNETGSAQTRFMIIRGNSGSGKSTLAMTIRSSLPRGVAIIAQDVLRWTILHVHDKKGSPAVDFIDVSARFALNRGLHVIVEGILHNEIYGDMLRALVPIIVE